MKETCEQNENLHYDLQKQEVKKKNKSFVKALEYLFFIVIRYFLWDITTSNYKVNS